MAEKTLNNVFLKAEIPTIEIGCSRITQKNGIESHTLKLDKTCMRNK
jgi:hypothetical protein